ncbi:MAG TPA: PKD domain-containing protein [Bacteroidia bacterium]|nr:PKD domain-containing protein [Bacteroidia bacterium]
MKRLLLKFIIAGTLMLAQFIDLPDASAQVVNTESFDSITFPPAGWAITGGAGSLWVRRTTGNNPTCTPHSGAAMARFTVFMGPPGDQELMTTPVIDYSGASGSIPTVSLWIYRDGGSTAGDSLSIFVNTANTLTAAVHIGAVARSRFFFLPQNEPADGWYQYTFNVPTSFNTDTNYILLNGTARGGENIFIDDVSWDEYPVACTSAFTAGNVTASDTLICGGSGDADLGLTGTGLNAGGLTYQWQSGPTNTGPWTDFGISAGTINTGPITTSTWFRCYVSCSNGGATDTSSVLFIEVSPNPVPVVTINPGQTVNFCSGSDPLVLVASGATTYTWTPNIATNTVGDSALAAPLVSTTYTVIGMDTTGCSGSANITVNVVASPIATATVNFDTICSGQSVNLHAFVQGPPFGITYVWQPGNLVGQNQTVSPVATTVYTVSATSGTTGCTGYDSIEVVVNPSPVAGFTFSVNNLTYTFTDTSAGATSWLWDFGDSSTDITQNPVHTYALAGTYTITLTVSNGMCSDTYTITITVVSVNYILSNGSALQVYPNPASDIATVEFTYDESSAELSVMNSTGQYVINKTIYPSGNLFRSDLDMSALSPGIYVLQVKAKSETVFLQLVKE